jgi:Uma2 family endonuclease
MDRCAEIPSTETDWKIAFAMQEFAMTAAEQKSLVSEADYLAGELASTTKHEYLGGVIHAMAGAGNLHNDIAINVTSTLHANLRGKPCRTCNSDTKIRVRLPSQVRYYYPDASVVCRPNPADDSYQDEPVVIVEVLSPSTRRVDLTEKKDAYLTIPSLMAYLLVEQDQPAVEVFRRGPQGFVAELYRGLDAVVPLPEVGAELALKDVYERIHFPSIDG